MNRTFDPTRGIRGSISWRRKMADRPTPIGGSKGRRRRQKHHVARGWSKHGLRHQEVQDHGEGGDEQTPLSPPTPQRQTFMRW